MGPFTICSSSTQFFPVLRKVWSDALFCSFRFSALPAIRQGAALWENVAWNPAILPAAHLPHSSSILPVADTHCPAVPATVLTAATLARTGIVFHLPHGLFPCYLQTTQRAVLYPGRRV